MASASPLPLPPGGTPTRERLVRTALRLFAERGYGGVSNREIVEACGCTKGAIYWYFESKDDLFRAVLSETLADFQVRLADGIGSAATWQEKLSRLFALFVEVLEADDDPHRDLLLLMLHRTPRGPGQADLGPATQQRMVHWIAEILAEGGASAETRDLVALIHAAGLGVLVQAAAGTAVARPVLTALLRVIGGGELELPPPSR
jgi:TetR/AcrR family transcriptional regulator, cholesterol catabolism regulator